MHHKNSNYMYKKRFFRQTAVKCFFLNICIYFFILDRSLIGYRIWYHEHYTRFYGDLKIIQDLRYNFLLMIICDLVPTFEK